MTGPERIDSCSSSRSEFPVCVACLQRKDADIDVMLPGRQAYPLYYEMHLLTLQTSLSWLAFLCKTSLIKKSRYCGHELKQPIAFILPVLAYFAYFMRKGSLVVGLSCPCVHPCVPQSWNNITRCHLADHTGRPVQSTKCLHPLR